MASPSETARAAILGVPFDPNRKPDRVMTVKAFEQMDAKIIGVSAGAIIRDTLSGLNAVTNPPAKQMAWVLGDGTVANNGVYENAGTPSAPVWVRRGDLPFGVISCMNTGHGTPDAIVAISALPVSDSALVLLNIVETNTGSPVTVSFNGGTPLTIKTNSGNDVAPGGLRSGMGLVGRVFGSTFRLLSDQASAAIVAEMEQILNGAVLQLTEDTQDLRDETQGFANAAASSATDAEMYAEMVGAAVYDFSFDSDPELPGYDWSE